MTWGRTPLKQPISISGGSPTRFHSGVVLSKTVQFRPSDGVYVITSYSNACDVKVANSNHKICYNLFSTCMLQASLPVTAYCCTENKLAEISSSLRQPEQIKKDYSHSKLIIKSADLTENGYPRTLTSSHPSDNVIQTSAEVTREAVEIT